MLNSSLLNGFLSGKNDTNNPWSIAGKNATLLLYAQKKEKKKNLERVEGNPSYFEGYD